MYYTGSCEQYMAHGAIIHIVHVRVFTLLEYWPHGMIGRLAWTHLVSALPLAETVLYSYHLMAGRTNCQALRDLQR